MTGGEAKMALETHFFILTGNVCFQCIFANFFSGLLQVIDFIQEGFDI